MLKIAKKTMALKVGEWRNMSVTATDKFDSVKQIEDEKFVKRDGKHEYNCSET